MANETLYAFNEADSQALLQSIGAKASGGSNQPDHVSTSDTLLATATSTITGRAGTTLGTGTAMAKQISSAGVLSDLFTIDVVNPGSAIANASTLFCFRVGNRWVAVEIC
jgi:hypothetical protein